jgi:hypothetical protein
MSILFANEGVERQRQNGPIADGSEVKSRGVLLVVRLAALLASRLGLVILSVVAVARIRPIAPPEPPTQLLRLLTNPDGSPCQLPCLFGVQPTMPWSDAWEVVRSHPLIQQLQLSGVHENSIRFSGRGVAVSLDSPYDQSLGPEVASVHLFSISERPDEDQPAVSLGDILTTLGRPDSVHIGVHQVWLLYFNNHFLIAASRHIQGSDRLDVHSQVTLIAWTGESAGFQCVGQAVPWLGFSAMERYELWEIVYSPGFVHRH